MIGWLQMGTRQCVDRTVVRVFLLEGSVSNQGRRASAPENGLVCQGVCRLCHAHCLSVGTVGEISPANVVGKAHWYSDKLTVRGMVPWRQTMVRIPAGAQCEWCWARATTLITTPAKHIGRGEPEPWPGCTYPPFLNPPPVHWW